MDQVQKPVANAEKNDSTTPAQGVEPDFQISLDSFIQFIQQIARIQAKMLDDKLKEKIVPLNHLVNLICQKMRVFEETEKSISILLKRVEIWDSAHTNELFIVYRDVFRLCHEFYLTATDNGHRPQGINEANAKSYYSALTTLKSRLKDILLHMNWEVYDEKSAYNPEVDIVVAQRPTDDQSLDNTILRVISPGLKTQSKIVQRKIELWKYLNK